MFIFKEIKIWTLALISLLQMILLLNDFVFQRVGYYLKEKLLKIQQNIFEDGAILFPILNWMSAFITSSKPQYIWFTCLSTKQNSSKQCNNQSGSNYSFLLPRSDSGDTASGIPGDLTETPQSENHERSLARSIAMRGIEYRAWIFSPEPISFVRALKQSWRAFFRSQPFRVCAFSDLLGKVPSVLETFPVVITLCHVVLCRCGQHHYRISI